jgi:hypothetical protein
MSRVTVGAEADFATNERLEGAQGRVVARTPSFPNTLWSLASVDVATAPAAVPVAPMDAVTANQTIQARPNRFRGGNGFNQDPNLNHVTGFPVVRRGFKAGGDDNAGMILVKEEAVQREPPMMSSATQ